MRHALLLSVVVEDNGLGQEQAVLLATRAVTSAPGVDVDRVDVVSTVELGEHGTVTIRPCGLVDIRTDGP